MKYFVFTSSNGRVWVVLAHSIQNAQKKIAIKLAGVQVASIVEAEGEI